jgi:hypothetical protein
MTPDRITRAALVVIAAALAWTAMRPHVAPPPAEATGASGSAGARSSAVSCRFAAWSGGRDPQPAPPPVSAGKLSPHRAPTGRPRVHQLHEYSGRLGRH